MDVDANGGVVALSASGQQRRRQLGERLVARLRRRRRVNRALQATIAVAAIGLALRAAHGDAVRPGPIAPIASTPVAAASTRRFGDDASVLARLRCESGEHVLRLDDAALLATLRASGRSGGLARIGDASHAVGVELDRWEVQN